MITEKIFKNKYLVLIFAVLATLLWGSAFPFVKIGYQLFTILGEDTYHKILFAGYRFLMAGLLILMFSLFTKQNLKLNKSQFKDALILGILMTTLQYSFFYLGLSNTTGVKGAILNSTSVFFTFIMAHFLLKGDRLTSKKILGVVIGFAGIIIINYSPELFSFDFKLTGEGFLLFAQVTGAYGSIYLKRISNSVSVIAITGYQMVLGSLILIVPAWLKVGFWPFVLKPWGLILLFYLAFLSAMAFSLWNTLLKYNQVGKLAIFKFLIPVFGVLLSGLFLPEERITSLSLLALAIVSSGIIIVNYSSQTKKQTKKQPY